MEDGRKNDSAAIQDSHSGKLDQESISKIQQCVKELDESIDMYGSDGKVPIAGYPFHVRYAKNLSECMHRVISGDETDYERASNLIVLQLIASSKDWRKVSAILLNAIPDEN